MSKPDRVPARVQPAAGAHLRIARPTDRLDQLVGMYRDGLGLTILSEFEDHDGFDGVMLGYRVASWHLEFTRRRDHLAGGEPSGEHLLVLYLPDRERWLDACQMMERAGFQKVPADNPYWDRAGCTFEDVDGYRVVLQNSAWR